MWTRTFYARLNVASFLCSSAIENIFEYTKSPHVCSPLKPKTAPAIVSGSDGGPGEMSQSFGGDADQCCKVYQMHAIVTTVTAIFCVHLYFVFLFYLTRQQSIRSENAHKFIYDFYTCSLFLLLFWIYAFIISFCNILFRVAAAHHRGAASSLLLGDSVLFFVVLFLPVSCASVKRVCEVYRVPKVFINGDY